MSTIVIETPRLYLREMETEDFEALNKVLGDDENMKHYPHTFDETRVRNWIKRNQDRYKVWGFGLWAVCLKETGEMIGDCGLTVQTMNKGVNQPEIGYHIRRDMQRKGYAREAAMAVCKWTFENTPIRIIYSYMNKTNVASSSCAQSWGCTYVEEYREDARNQTTEVYALTREVWVQSQK